MSTSLDQEIEQTGKATAVVILKGALDPAGSSVDPNELDHNFISGSYADHAAAFRPHVQYKGKASFFQRLGLMIGAVDRKGLDGLRSDTKRVHSVGIAPHYRLLFARRSGQRGEISDPDWGLTNLGVQSLWEQGFTGTGVKVGHLDTGVDSHQPSVAQAVDEFTSISDDGSIIAVSRNDLCWHGTHTAGIIAGRPVSGQPTVGMAPGAMLESAIIGSCPDSDEPPHRLVAGMEWAVAKGVRVINMSIGLNRAPDDGSFASIIQILLQKGVLAVCAIGNGGPGTSVAPGNCTGMLSVGACDESGNIWPGSGSQSFSGPLARIVPDLVAPGVDITSSVPDRFGTWLCATGTSTAAPHISGLAALLMQARPDATAAQIQAAIFRSCVQGASMVVGRGNRGIPNAVRALSNLP